MKAKNSALFCWSETEKCHCYLLVDHPFFLLRGFMPPLFYLLLLQLHAASVECQILCVPFFLLVSFFSSSRFVMDHHFEDQRPLNRRQAIQQARLVGQSLIPRLVNSTIPPVFNIPINLSPRFLFSEKIRKDWIFFVCRRRRRWRYNMLRLSTIAAAKAVPCTMISMPTGFCLIR